MMIGTLFLVVGASGVGKDSLIEGARRRLASDPRYVFARRVITRPADAGGEDHIAVNAEEFARRERAGAFALAWRANGLAYGIPDVILRDLTQGRHVIANVSRLVLEEARRICGSVRVIWITAPTEIVATRLAARGRESASEIAERLARGTMVQPSGPDIAVLVNDRSLNDGIDAMVELLRPVSVGQH